jgi:hypothetical protein
MINKFEAWHKSKLGLLVLAIIELAITYGFASVAIDRGGLGWYLLTLIFLVGFLQNLVRFFGALVSKDTKIKKLRKRAIHG